MSHCIANGLGDSLNEPTREQMRRFLADIDATDQEHGAASLSTDAEVVLEWNGDGRLVYDAGEAPVRHLSGVSRDEALDLFCALAEGRLQDVEARPWQPGNGFILTEERRREIESWQRTQDRDFYDLLGPERPDVPCKTPGCTRGAISLSVLCRPHHFEMVQRRPSPFQD